jgi:formamidopyrimidine-DNA glycosylase
VPELPEVETVRRGLQRVFEGGPIARVEARRPDLRFPFPEGFVARLKGRRVTTLGRRAKYLIGALDSGETLVMHLGMSGSFRIEQRTPTPPSAAERGREFPADVSGIIDQQAAGIPSPSQGEGRVEVAAAAAEPGKEPSSVPVGEFYHPRSEASAHDHVVFHFASGPRVVYNDPRRFGSMTLVETAKLDAHPLFAGLGVEPLSDAFDAAHLAEILRDVRAPLKGALLDQRRIAGLGNIYVSEALYRAKLSPLTPAGEAPRAKVKALHRAIRQVLEEAIEAGGSTLRDHRQADGELGYFQHSFAVYDREGAACAHRGCKGMITRIVQTGRSTFYCPECQR